MTQTNPLRVDVVLGADGASTRVRLLFPDGRAVEKRGAVDFKLMNGAIDGKPGVPSLAEQGFVPCPAVDLVVVDAAHLEHLREDDDDGEGTS